MIAKFFNTSKPIHSVIISAFILVVFIITRSTNYLTNFNIIELLKDGGKYLVILASVFILDFLVNKNKLTKKNGYEILIYSLLLVIFPATLKETNIITANLFLVLALRRIISLRSNLNIKKKLFDAAFWIGIAALFHFWSILFLGLIIAAIVLYAIPNVKNWIVPLIGVIMVILIVLCYHIIVDNNINSLVDYVSTTELSFQNYSINSIISVSIVSGLSVFALIYYLLNLGNINKTLRPSFVLIFIAFLIGVVVMFISPNKNSSELLFTFPALTIIMSNYIESLAKRWFAEIYLWTLVLLPVAILLL